MAEKKKSPQQKGKAAEHLFFSMLLDRGYEVYVPLADDKGIDAIVRNGGKEFAEIQIKSREKDAKLSHSFADISYKKTSNNFWFAFRTWNDKKETWWLLSAKNFEKHARKESKGTWAITLDNKNEKLNEFIINEKLWKEFDRSFKA